MIVDENVTDYLRSLIREEDAFLERIEREARKNHVPIVKPETKEFLKLFKFYLILEIFLILE